MKIKAFQDYYSDQLSYCYGCGRLNDNGLRIKSYWSDDENTSIARFTPKPYHTAFPGYVYGGLLASLIDCHGTGTAAAYKSEGRKMGTQPELRYVITSVHVDYIKLTPINQELELIGSVKEIKERKVIVEVKLFTKGILCVQGEVIAVKIPKDMISTK